MEECHAAQCILEKEKVSKDKQWSSAETELSGNDDSGSDEENVRSLFPNKDEFVDIFLSILDHYSRTSFKINCFEESWEEEEEQRSHHSMC